MSPDEVREIATAYLPLAVRIARTWVNKHAPGDNERLQDATQEAAAAMLSALYDFDPSRGTRLATWICSHIEWGLWDRLGRPDDPLPQEQRARVKDLRHGQRWLAHRLKREPTEEEVARELGWPLEKVRSVRSLEALRTLSLDEEAEPLEADDGDPVADLERKELMVTLARCFAELPVQEKLALRVRLAGGTMKDIQSLLGVSQAAGYRRVQAACDHMRACVSAA